MFALCLSFLMNSVERLNLSEANRFVGICHLFDKTLGKDSRREKHRSRAAAEAGDAGSEKKQRKLGLCEAYFFDRDSRCS